MVPATEGGNDTIWIAPSIAAATASQKTEALEAWQEIRDHRPAYVKLTYDADYPQSDFSNHDQFEFKRRGERMCFFEYRVETHKGETKKRKVQHVIVTGFLSAAVCGVNIWLAFSIPVSTSAKQRPAAVDADGPLPLS